MDFMIIKRRKLLLTRLVDAVSDYTSFHSSQMYEYDTNNAEFEDVEYKVKYEVSRSNVLHALSKCMRERFPDNIASIFIEIETDIIEHGIREKIAMALYNSIKALEGYNFEIKRDEADDDEVC